jgi:hypothetical protein
MPRVERTQSLERSQTSPRRLKLPTSPRRYNSGRLRRAGRFLAWQLYRLLAGGSRECLEVWQFYGPVVSNRTE